MYVYRYGKIYPTLLSKVETIAKYSLIFSNLCILQFYCNSKRNCVISYTSKWLKFLFLKFFQYFIAHALFLLLIYLQYLQSRQTDRQPFVAIDYAVALGVTFFIFLNNSLNFHFFFSSLILNLHASPLNAAIKFTHKIPPPTPNQQQATATTECNNCIETSKQTSRTKTTSVALAKKKKKQKKHESN